MRPRLLDSKWKNYDLNLRFPGDLDGKEFTYNVGDLSSVRGVGRSPGGGHGNPLQ